MPGLTLQEMLVLGLIFAALAWLLVAAVRSRPRHQLNEADQYIARLNEAAARQQAADTERAEQLRLATTQRTAAARRASTGRTGQGASSTAGRAATERQAAARLGATDPEYAEVLALVQAGKTREAVQKIHHDTGIPLTEARKFVDSLQAS